MEENGVDRRNAPFCKDSTGTPAVSSSWTRTTPCRLAEELDCYPRKRIHNLKYYTWVEQQGKTYDEIQAQWYDPDYWTGIQAMADPIDEMIESFNSRIDN
jgi:hypothetical protein